MESLGIDGKLLVAQLINFGLFFLIFKKFMAKPFFEFIKKQQDVEKQKEKMMETMKLEEAKLEKKENDIVDKAREEANEIIAQAKKTAKKVEEQLLEKTNQEVATLKKKAQEQIEQERKELLSHTKQDILKTSSALVKTVLVDVLDKKTSEQIVSAFLKKTNSTN